MYWLKKIKRNIFKGESDLSELTKATDLIPGKFDDYERERQKKDKIIKELKSVWPMLKTSKINSITRNSTRIEIVYWFLASLKHNTKTQTIFLYTGLDHTNRIGNSKSGNKRPWPIIVKFAHYNTKRKVFVGFCNNRFL